MQALLAGGIETHPPQPHSLCSPFAISAAASRTLPATRVPQSEPPHIPCALDMLRVNMGVAVGEGAGVRECELATFAAAVVCVAGTAIGMVPRLLPHMCCSTSGRRTLGEGGRSKHRLGRRRRSRCSLVGHARRMRDPYCFYFARISPFARFSRFFRSSHLTRFPPGQRTHKCWCTRPPRTTEDAPPARSMEITCPRVLCGPTPTIRSAS